jgi:hypothetical protein
MARINDETAVILQLLADIVGLSNFDCQLVITLILSSDKR